MLDELTSHSHSQLLRLTMTMTMSSLTTSFCSWFPLTSQGALSACNHRWRDMAMLLIDIGALRLMPCALLSAGRQRRRRGGCILLYQGDVRCLNFVRQDTTTMSIVDGLTTHMELTRAPRACYHP